MPDQGEPKPTGLAPTVEMLAKSIALIAAVGLGVGFLYDFVFFFTLDPRLSGVMSMADHIETAVFALPYLVMLALINLFHAYTHFLSPTKGKYVVAAVFVVVACVAFAFPNTCS